MKSSGFLEKCSIRKWCHPWASKYVLFNLMLWKSVSMVWNMIIQNRKKMMFFLIFASSLVDFHSESGNFHSSSAEIHLCLFYTRMWMNLWQRVQQNTQVVGECWFLNACKSTLSKWALIHECTGPDIPQKVFIIMVTCRFQHFEVPALWRLQKYLFVWSVKNHSSHAWS